MSFSPHDGFVAFGAGTLPDAERPVDTAEVRGIVVNNAIWACEQAAQVRIKKMVAREADEHVRDGSRELVVDTWYPLFRTRFDCHLHPYDGAYRFRVRFAGRATQGHAVSFRLIISGPAQVESEAIADPVFEHAREFSSSSSTHAWLTPDSGGSNVITVPAENVAAAIVPQAQKSSISGSLSSVPVCSLAAQVWFSTANVSSRGAMSGLVVEEYIGL
jgi:hypothetical protein